MSARIRIFAIDDEEDLTDLLHYQLGREGYEVKFANNPFEALGKARDFIPDLILLDVMMPDLDGYQVLRMIRSDNLLKSVPVIMLTAKSGVEDRIKGLERGADDYMGKPFDPRELILRINTVLKRTTERSEESSKRLMMGNLLLDEEDHSVTIGGEKQDFTLTEFKLLHYFLKRQGRYRPGIIYFWVCGSSMRMWRPAPSMCTSAGYGRSLSNPPSRSKRSAVWAIVCLSN